MEMLAEHVRTWGSMDVVHNTYDHINIQLLGITKIAGGNIASMLLVSHINLYHFIIQTFTLTILLIKYLEILL